MRWPWSDKVQCLPCESRGEHIEFLMERVKDCPSCRSYAGQIEYIKTLLEREVEGRLKERDEYKRAIDRLIEFKGARPLEQGVSSITPPEAPEADDMARMFDEVA